MHQTPNNNSSRPISPRGISLSFAKVAACSFLTLLSLLCLHLALTAIPSNSSAAATLSTPEKLKQNRFYDQQIEEKRQQLNKLREEHFAQKELLLYGSTSSTTPAFGHLIMVAGHGVFRGSDFSSPFKILDENSWALEKFQLGQFIPQSIISHISQGLKILVNDPTATLVFSGGQSRKDCGARSEGGTYLDLVIQQNSKNLQEIFFAADKTLSSSELATLQEILSNQTNLPSESNERRILAEEFARDSYENLLFSICRYFQYHGRFPKKITVIGFPHKRERFVEWHRTAILWPRSQFYYAGVQAKEVSAMISEGKLKQPSDQKTLARTKMDPYLCKANKQTRINRNPNRQVAPYRLVAGMPLSVKKLLDYCGPGFFHAEEKLPWVL
jgi:hypothetical protein